MTTTTKTTQKLLTKDEMMDQYFVRPDISLEAYYDYCYPNKDVDYDYFLFEFSNSMNGVSRFGWDSWAEGVEDEAIEDARERACKDGYEVEDK